MEGFWTVQFAGIQGFGAGVVTLIGGQVFGGDSGFLYAGTFKAQGSDFSADVAVRRYAAGTQSVMGVDRFNLTLKGVLNGNTISVNGGVAGTPMQFKATLTKQADLPR
ncbi:MAG: hypothetical protein M3O31_16050 [Acidobacteriota bacterium]|nr:hypothetical protein [Acidobacteriota bacterium]